MSTSTSQAAQQPLQAISNIIELKPDRKYLLVFKGNDMDLSMLHALDDVLKAAEIHCISIALSDGVDLTVIEAPPSPAEQAPASEDGSPFLGGSD